MADIYDFLANLDIVYERCDHPPVFTCEEAEKLVPSLPGAKTKNLFLRDRRGRRLFLVVVECHKLVDLSALARVLGVSKLGMCSEERLRKYLGVEAGAVTILGVINDHQKVVEVIIDEEVWQQPFLQCHPLVNTSTVVIAREDIGRFLEATGHILRVVQVPARETVSCGDETKCG